MSFYNSTVEGLLQTPYNPSSLAAEDDVDAGEHEL